MDDHMTETTSGVDQQMHDYMTAGSVLDRISSELYLSTEGIFVTRLSDVKLNAIGEAAVMLYNNVARFGGEYSASIIMANLSSDLITTRHLLATAVAARDAHYTAARRQETIAIIAGVVAVIGTIVAIWLWLR